MRSERDRAENLAKMREKEANMNEKRRQAASARAAAKEAAAQRDAEAAGKRYFPPPPVAMRLSMHPLALAIKGKLDQKIRLLLMYGEYDPEVGELMKVPPDSVLDDEG